MVARSFASLRRRAARVLRRIAAGAGRAGDGQTPQNTSLEIDLVDGALVLGGHSATPVVDVELVARATRAVTTIPLAVPGSDFRAVIALETLVASAAGTAENIELFLVAHEGRSRQRVGNFLSTTRPERRLSSTVGGVPVVIDVTDYGNVLVMVGRAIEPRIRVSTLVATETIAGTLEIGLIARSARDSIDEARVRFRARQSDAIFEVPLEVTFDADGTRREHGRLVYRIHGGVRVADVVAATPTAGEVVDVWLVAKTGEGRESTVRVAAPQSVVSRRARPLVATAEDNADVLVPYATARVHALSYARERFVADDYRYMLRWARLWPLISLVRWVRPVWLIGEVPYKAQDNGMHMFRYIRTRHPRRRAFYVIERESPDLGKVSDLGNVVFFGSREHIRMALRASRFAGSHHAEYLFPSRDPHVVGAMRGVRVFLRHGVTAMKNMKHVYGRAVDAQRPAERYIVASERERSIVVNDYGYRRSQVIVAGFARFDVLLDHPPAPQPTVLVMPTWRGDLLREEAFLDSEYFAQWRGFLLSTRLTAVLAEHGADVTLLLHPNMRKFAEYFDHPQIRQVHLGEADVQDLLRSSAMLVTDMSSVAWDFAFLRRPVAFFLFDFETMTRNRESHVDILTELPGPVVLSVDALVDSIDTAARSGFVASDADYAKARVFLTHGDLRNRERVYRVIRFAWRPSTVFARIGEAIKRRRWAPN